MHKKTREHYEQSEMVCWRPENQGVLIHIWPVFEWERMIQEVLQSINNPKFEEKKSKYSQVNCIKSDIPFLFNFFQFGNPEIEEIVWQYLLKH